MDELSALKLIFRNNLICSADSITIKNQMIEYLVNSETMAIIDPAHSYADVYDYILKDIQKCAVKTGTEITGIYEALPEYEKITEEQFHSWQRGQQSMAPQNSAERLSGKEIWMLGVDYVDEE